MNFTQHSALATQHFPTLGVRIAVLRRFDVGWNKDIPSLNQIAPEYGIGPNTRQCLTRGLEPADECYARKVAAIHHRAWRHTQWLTCRNLERWHQSLLIRNRVQQISRAVAGEDDAAHGDVFGLAEIIRGQAGDGLAIVVDGGVCVGSRGNRGGAG